MPGSSLADPHLAATALVAPPSFNFVADVLHQRARSTPARVAVIGISRSREVEEWTFADMAEASDRLAGALLELGIKHADRVVIFMNRNPHWMIAMSACLHIGAIPVPCVTQVSASELSYRVSLSGARGAIASSDLTSRFSDVEAALPVRIAHGKSPGWLDLQAIIDTPRKAPPTAHMAAETPALMYFTSGSSGPPKAVVHAARSVYVRCWQPWTQLGMNDGDVIWTTSDTGWTRAASCLLFGAWMNNATSLIVEDNLSPSEKVDVLARHGVTIYGAVATELRQIMVGAGKTALPRLRLTLSAGEAMTAELSELWTAFSGAPLIVGYGQTETATSTLTDPTREAVNGMIGRAIDGNDISVLKDGQQTGPGEHGEIAFAGNNPGLMLGYWSGDNWSAAFDRDGWHMTGDSGYVDTSGNLFFVGRSDDVISSSGYRIGPTEVENALMRHPSVQECAVAASPDPGRGEVVKAFIVLRSNVAASDRLAGEIQDFVKKEIAPFKYPRRIEFVNDLPRTASGKISRRALREREIQPGDKH
jgi:acyl-coenzyme A synthetase/AMP-(fatty) acid ligase